MVSCSPIISSCPVTSQNNWSPPVPHYLRTKLDLDLEARERDLHEEAGQKEADIKEDISLFNNMLSSALDRVNEARNELEEQRNKASRSCDNHIHSLRNAILL